MEVIYQVLLDVYKEIEEEMDKEGKANCFHYAKEAVSAIFTWWCSVVARHSTKQINLNVIQIIIGFKT